MNMLREDIKDKRLIELIKKYLKSGVMENGIVMLYAVSLTNPLIITENTTQFNIGFGLSGSVSVDFTTLDGSDEFLMITKHGADPVDILFTAN